MDFLCTHFLAFWIQWELEIYYIWEPPPRWEEYFIEKTDDLEQGVELMVDGAEVAKSVNLLAIARGIARVYAL